MPPLEMVQFLLTTLPNAYTKQLHSLLTWAKMAAEKSRRNHSLQLNNFTYFPHSLKKINKQNKNKKIKKIKLKAPPKFNFNSIVKFQICMTSLLVKLFCPEIFRIFWLKRAFVLLSFKQIKQLLTAKTLNRFQLFQHLLTTFRRFISILKKKSLWNSMSFKSFLHWVNLPAVISTANSFLIWEIK